MVCMTPLRPYQQTGRFVDKWQRVSRVADILLTTKIGLKSPCHPIELRHQPCSLLVKVGRSQVGHSTIDSYLYSTINSLSFSLVLDKYDLVVSIMIRSLNCSLMLKANVVALRLANPTRIDP